MMEGLNIINLDLIYMKTILIKTLIKINKIDSIYLNKMSSCISLTSM